VSECDLKLATTVRREGILFWFLSSRDGGIFHGFGKRQKMKHEIFRAGRNRFQVPTGQCADSVESDEQWNGMEPV